MISPFPDLSHPVFIRAASPNNCFLDPDFPDVSGERAAVRLS